METAKLFINNDALQIKELPDKGRAFCNSFPTALLVTMSNANHSCNPNARVDEVEGFPSPVYQLTAKRDIQCGEEVTISYIDLVANVELAEDRQRYLEEHFLFYCLCEWCHAPQPTTGLLAGLNDAVHGPLHEDYACTAFQWKSENESSAEITCESGKVGKLTGRCTTCGKTATQKQLDNICRKSDRLILSLRRMLVETNAFVEAVRAGGNSTSTASNTPSDARSRQSTTESAKSFATTSTMKEEGVKNAATLKELKRLQSLMKGMETRAIELLHSSHIAFVPIRACLDDLQELIGAGSLNGSKIRNGARKAENRDTDASKNGTIEALVQGVEDLLN
ncbi:hypothetical protein CcCBS67573_g10269 [Chytriomyces confervae]|uniref:Histone-lysine N-methyltransferase SET5 n=1 Tax=Chytriomyces confervae TaxID=246404 RepID=A0A507D6J4_9FUNG|nr:hypothetical protein CcCBS67573_g10269 [Chytriomyces confervae]